MSSTHAGLSLVSEPAAVRNAVKDVERADNLTAVGVVESRVKVSDLRELLDACDARRQGVAFVVLESRALDVVAGQCAERRDERLLELGQLHLIRSRQVLRRDKLRQRRRGLIEHVDLCVLEELLRDVVPERLVRLQEPKISREEGSGDELRHTEICCMSRYKSSEIRRGIARMSLIREA